ncbi:MAG: heavy metal translocating P-type ATPase metal-binding domain-containing protein [Candidatus Zixiibacteriota bacterium]
MTVNTTQQKTACFHCGQPCLQDTTVQDGNSFCCAGCRSVYQLLSGARLSQYYQAEQAPGVRPAADRTGRHAYLDDAQVQDQLLDYAGEARARITLSIPQMHCASCVWLLENLYRLESGVLRSEVSLPDRRLVLTFDKQRISLRQIVELLTRLGYEPEIKLANLDRKPERRTNWRLYARTGVAGFSFANIMLFSFPEYLSSDGIQETGLSLTFRIASLILAIPVLLYSSADYFRSALTGLRQRTINLDVPIALGIGMLFLRSSFDIIAGIGPGYLDSFTGLVFFLLLGRLFQQKTFDRLSFDRDYRAYFPISCVKRAGDAESTVPITQLRPGDRILVRNQELVPADAVLINGQGSIDYSFVTGESHPKELISGDRVYAGGRQTGEAIDLEVIREVSDSYLISLWQDSRLAAHNRPSLTTLANSIGKHFIALVLATAAGAAVYWGFHDSTRLAHVVTSVLIVACPCALALASPFVLGTAARIWGDQRFFVRTPQVIENLSQIDTIVFDKTGTLTQADRQSVTYEGVPLTSYQKKCVAALARQSTHPSSRVLAQTLPASIESAVTDFAEIPGKGISGTVDSRQIRLGSRSWVQGEGSAVDDPVTPPVDSSVTFVSVDGRVLGYYRFENVYREGVHVTMAELGAEYRLALLSGDGSRERERMSAILGSNAELSFQQSPHDKLDYISRLHDRGRQVLMLGDGLNDAGALRAATVGVAVTEDSSSFAPACDGILEASSLGSLPRFLAMARRGRTVIIAAFGLSLIYNIVGLGFAVSGKLSPLVSAVLMPISSVSVVLFSTIATRLVARREGLC